MDTDLQPAPARRRASALALLAAGGLGGIVLGLGGIAAADDAPASGSTSVEQSTTAVQDSTTDSTSDDAAPAAGDLCDDPGAAAPSADAPAAPSGTAGGV